MKVAIVHYHLSPGGVSTVIQTASAALTAALIPHVILVGSSPDLPLPLQIVEGLGYRKQPGNLTPESLLENLRQAAQLELGDPPDIWHFHNHSLGKNILIPGVVDLLALAGEPLVLQLHDLAEDGRPQNFPFIAGQPLYPISPQIRYAFINSRDRNHFIAAGLPEEHATFFPNPVPTPKQLSNSTSPFPLLLYPSRAIRRKNLGEILLLSLLFPGGTRIAITRAPESPDALGIYNSWKHFAGLHEFPVDFEVVDSENPFEPWISRATHFITTSVAEGFGFAYAEAAAFGKPLIGRNLPEINHTIPAGALYDRILIPADWISPELLRQQLVRDLTETYRLYQQPLSPKLIESAFRSLHLEDHLDFGNLPETLQRSIITRLLENQSGVLIEAQGQRHPARRWLAQSLSSITGVPPTRPSDENLTTLYQQIFATPAAEVTHLDSQKILHTYLTPTRFHFLLTAPPKEIRAVIFDIYGTLLIAPPGAIKPDPTFDPALTNILENFGHQAPRSPTRVLHEAIVRHHQSSPHPHPEIDLRTVWQEILKCEVTRDLIEAIEDARHPCEAMPGAAELIHQLSENGMVLGLLSNAQINTLPALDHALGKVSHLFDPTLTILSYQHLIAKPSPRLFEILTERLAALGISPNEALFIGNDPLQDILPATAAGFRTALFTGHPASLRPGECQPDLVLKHLTIEVGQGAWRSGLYRLCSVL